MNRQFLALLAGGIGTAAALLGAPHAAAEEYGGGGPDNPLLPTCNVGNDSGGSSDSAASAIERPQPGSGVRARRSRSVSSDVASWSTAGISRVPLPARPAVRRAGQSPRPRPCAGWR